MKTWGFYYSEKNKNDAPVIVDFRRKIWHFYYIKTFKIQYLIYKELGKENYRKFVRDVSREMKNITYTNTTTIALLKKYKQMNWKKFLSGWVYEGKYEVFSFESFGDKDKNGVVDIIDFYKKNPLGLPAGYGQTP